MSRFLSRFWPLFVLLMLVAALSVAVAEDYNDLANTNASPTEAAPAAPAAEAVQPLGAQPAEGMRAPAEAPSPSEQQEQQQQPQNNQDQNNNPNANQ